MPSNDAPRQTTSEPKDLPDFLRFVEAEKANPPTREKASVVWNELIATLDKLKGDKENQGRFLSLLKQEVQPSPTDQAGPAAALPADHAYNLLEQLRELDRPWYKTYSSRATKWASGAGIGAAFGWLSENFDPSWIGFGIAVAIGYLMQDYFYDDGSIASAAVIGLLVAALLQLPEGKPRRRRPVGSTFERCAAHLGQQMQLPERTLREDLKRERARVSEEKERAEKVRRQLEARLESTEERIEELQQELEEASQQIPLWKSLRRFFGS